MANRAKQLNFALRMVRTVSKGFCSLYIDLLFKYNIFLPLLEALERASRLACYPSHVAPRRIPNTMPYHQLCNIHLLYFPRIYRIFAPIAIIVFLFISVLLDSPLFSNRTQIVLHSKAKSIIITN